MSDGNCGWWVGPVWKLGGEVCTCSLGPGHEPPHLCTCGAFEGCGYPPGFFACPMSRNTSDRHYRLSMMAIALVVA